MLVVERNTNNAQNEKLVNSLGVVSSLLVRVYEMSWLKNYESTGDSMRIWFVPSTADAILRCVSTFPQTTAFEFILQFYLSAGSCYHYKER